MPKGDCKHITFFGRCKLGHDPIVDDEQCIDCEDYEEEE